MFTNVNNADCGVFTACAVKPSGCTGSYSGYAAIGASPNFALSIRQNIDAGYEETLCVECSNAAGSTIQKDGWVIEQTRNCATALTGANQASAHANVVIEYVDSATLHVAATTSIVFFTNPHATLCGDINSCSLKVQGCGSAYTAANLVIDATTGEVTAKKNVAAGYADTVCVSCMNSASSVINFDDWVVTQNPNCAILTQTGLTDQVFAYDAGATATTVYDSSTLFGNIRTSACPITACTLKQTGCSADLVAPFNTLLTIAGTTPFALKISQTQAVGYPNVVVCVTCTNSGMSQTNEITIR